LSEEGENGYELGHVSCQRLSKAFVELCCCEIVEGVQMGKLIELAGEAVIS
jgi:hypothetical protein